MRTYAHKPRAKARRRYMTEAEYTVFQSRFHQHADANAPKTPDGTVKKASKYRNQKVEHDGIMFDSKHELKCWLVLASCSTRLTLAKSERRRR
jgi:hypothetical protein